MRTFGMIQRTSLYYSHACHSSINVRALLIIIACMYIDQLVEIRLCTSSWLFVISSFPFATRQSTCSGRKILYTYNTAGLSGRDIRGKMRYTYNTARLSEETFEERQVYR